MASPRKNPGTDTIPYPTHEIHHIQIHNNRSSVEIPLIQEDGDNHNIESPNLARVHQGDPTCDNSASGQYSNAYWHPPHYDPSMWYGPSGHHYHYYNQGYYNSRYPSTDRPRHIPDEFVPPRREHRFSSSPSKVTPTHPNTATPSIAPNLNESDSLSIVASPIQYIWDIEPNDILCGRGAPTTYHHGNQLFRDLVKDYQTVYLCSKRSDKPRIATEIMEIVRSRGGRFLRRIKTTLSGRNRFAWEEIGEQRAYEKVCQALREGAPEIRRRMIATSNVSGNHVYDKENSLKTSKENRNTVSNRNYCRNDESKPSSSSRW